jgi:uncharacterized protein involved in exopolysaccharide biosynthesis
MNYLIRPRRKAATEPSEFTLEELLTSLGRGWRFLVAAAGMGALIAAFLIAIGHPIYQASIYVIPLADETPQSLGSLSAFIGKTNEKATPFLQYRFALTSTAVAKRLGDYDQIAHHIFAGEWNERKKSWEAPRDLKSGLIGGLRYIFGYRAWYPPDATRFAKYLAKMISVKTDLRTNVVQISITDRDRNFAINLLTALHNEAVEYLRDQLIATTQLKIQYLEQKIPTATVLEYREALVALLVEQEKLMITKRQGMPYAAQILDGPTAPAMPSSPSPALLLFVGMLSGIAVGSLVLIVVVFAPGKMRALAPPEGARSKSNARGLT